MSSLFNQVKSNQVKANQVKANQVKANRAFIAGSRLPKAGLLFLRHYWPLSAALRKAQTS